MFCDRYRIGFVERLDEYIAVFALGWAVNAPLVIFQALLSARDDNYIEDGRHYPSATEVATPLFIIFGWIIIAVLFGSLEYRTAFQVIPLVILSFENILNQCHLLQTLRAERLHDAAGLKVIRPL